MTAVVDGQMWGTPQAVRPPPNPLGRSLRRVGLVLVVTGVLVDLSIRTRAGGLAATAAVVCLCVGLAVVGRVVRPVGRVLLGVAALVSSFLFLRSSPWLVAMDIVTVLVVLALACSAERDRRPFDSRFAGLARRIWATVASILTAPPRALAALASLLPQGTDPARRVLWQVLRGAGAGRADPRDHRSVPRLRRSGVRLALRPGSGPGIDRPARPRVRGGRVAGGRVLRAGESSSRGGAPRDAHGRSGRGSGGHGRAHRPVRRVRDLAGRRGPAGCGLRAPDHGPDLRRVRQVRVLPAAVGRGGHGGPARLPALGRPPRDRCGPSGVRRPGRRRRAADRRHRPLGTGAPGPLRRGLRSDSTALLQHRVRLVARRRVRPGRRCDGVLRDPATVRQGLAAHGGRLLGGGRRGGAQPGRSGRDDRGAQPGSGPGGRDVRRVLRPHAVLRRDAGTDRRDPVAVRVGGQLAPWRNSARRRRRTGRPVGTSRCGVPPRPPTDSATDRRLRRPAGSEPDERRGLVGWNARGSTGIPAPYWQPSSTSACSCVSSSTPSASTRWFRVAGRGSRSSARSRCPPDRSPDRR